VKKHHILSKRPGQEPGSKDNMVKSEKALSTSGITTWPGGTKPSNLTKTSRQSGIRGYTTSAKRQRRFHIHKVNVNNNYITFAKIRSKVSC